MSEPGHGRVAVYIDFDNIVISWYDRVHGRNSYGRDRQRILETPNDPEIADRLSRATIDVGAIIDYAASFGTLVRPSRIRSWEYYLIVSPFCAPFFLPSSSSMRSHIACSFARWCQHKLSFETTFGIP